MAVERVRRQAATQNLRVTQHALREMIEEEITRSEVLETIATGLILENYPEHLRGACCLVSGATRKAVHYTLCVQRHSQSLSLLQHMSQKRRDG